MKKRLLAFLYYYIFWLLFFFIARTIFLLVQFRELQAYDTVTIIKSYIYGFRLDNSATAWLMMVPVLASIPFLSRHGKWFLNFLNIYTIILIISLSALVLGDAIVYSYWGFRLEFFIMEYLKTPGDAAASASTSQIILFAVSLFLVSWLFMHLYRKIIRKAFEAVNNAVHPSLDIAVLILLAIILIVPARGGFGSNTLNNGSAYFTRQLFPNHAAVNIAWNFASSAINGRPQTNPYLFTKKPEAEKEFNDLLADSLKCENVMNTTRPNILLIILESFGSSFSGPSGADSMVTPGFNALRKQGIYFENLYASGSRTDKALPSIFSGYPSLPAVMVIREARKVSSMPGIIKLLDSAGYKTSFWYGGDIKFANIHSFIKASTFREIITRDNFPRRDWDSKWGVHDKTLFEMLSDSLSGSVQPFAYAALTLSSHEPFEVPGEPVFKGKDMLSKFKNSLHYTDKALSEFIQKAMESTWWKNTLVIIMADHGRRNSINIPVYAEDIFKIPMLWTGGALKPGKMRITKYGNQFDLPLTLASQLGIRASFPFSKDLLSAGSGSFSFYTYHEGFVFITDSSKVVHDLRLGGNFEEHGINASLAERKGKAFLQVLFDDFLSR